MAPQVLGRVDRQMMLTLTGVAAAFLVVGACFGFYMTSRHEAEAVTDAELSDVAADTANGSDKKKKKKKKATHNKKKHNKKKRSGGQSGDNSHKHNADSDSTTHSEEELANDLMKEKSLSKWTHDEVLLWARSARFPRSVLAFFKEKATTGRDLAAIVEDDSYGFGLADKLNWYGINSPDACRAVAAELSKL